MRRWSLIVLYFFMFWWQLPSELRADGPMVQALLFYSDTCPHCEVVRSETLPPLLDKYGARLEIREMDITDPRNFELMLGFEAMHRIPEEQVGIPEIFIGDEYLIGETDIATKLDGLIEKYLAQGGVSYPVLSHEALATLQVQQQAPVTMPSSPTLAMPKNTLVTISVDPTSEVIPPMPTVGSIPNPSADFGQLVVGAFCVLLSLAGLRAYWRAPRDGASVAWMKKFSLQSSPHVLLLVMLVLLVTGLLLIVVAIM